MQRRIWLIGFALVLWGAGCSSSQKLPSEIDKVLSDHDPNFETVVILGTNDIHGGLDYQDLKTNETDPSKSISYQAGGAPILGSYIRLLRTQFGPHLIWLDAGDEFQGTIESNSEQGAPMVAFFNLMGLNAAAIGNHEFDFGLDVLKKRMTEAHYPYLAANILNKETGKLEKFPNTLPRFLITSGNLKVGVIGLSTLFTPTTTRAENVKTLVFSPLKEATIHEAAALRKEGANLVLIVAHVGIRCDHGKDHEQELVRRPDYSYGHCDNHDEMVKLVKSLPPGTIDAVVSGHSHTIVHDWVAGVPIIQGGAMNRYFNLLYLTYDHAKHRLLTDRTRIEGPIPICPKVFENQGDCNGDSQATEKGRGSLESVHFHGATISADSDVEEFLKPILEKSAEIKKVVVAQAARLIDHQRFKESELGDLVADSFRQAAHTDFALMNSGGIRAPLQPGEITYGDVFRAVPFDNLVFTLKMTGKEVKTLIRIAESGSRGFFSISGLRVKLIDPAYDAPSTDLNGDGKIEPWEINRLVEIETSDGKKLKDNQIYTLATIDYLVTGGDDVGWLMGKIPHERISHENAKPMRDVVVNYLKSFKKPINSLEDPIVEAAEPRLEFDRPSSSKRKHSHHKLGKTTN